MTNSKRMLLETLAGHFALLQAVSPRNANRAAAKRCHRYVQAKLRTANARPRAAA